MSVLCEGLSVIVTHSALEVTYPGGVEGYQRDCPNRTFCSDGSLTRVGFMHPDDVRSFVDAVVRRTGLDTVQNGRFVDIAIVDQLSGPTLTCDWLDFSRTGDVTRVWLSGTPEGDLAVPEGWTGPAQLRFYTTEEAEGMAVTPPTGGLQETVNTATGETEYIGRTSQGPAGTDAHFKDMLLIRRSDRDAMGALAVCTGWTEQRPTSPQAWYELGVSAAEIRRMDLAEDAWRKAVAIAPDFEVALANLGVAIIEQGRPTEAKAWLERALELDPRDPIALLHLGKSLIAAGQRDKASELLEQALDEARIQSMRGVEVEAAKTIDDLTPADDLDEELCADCGAPIDWDCEACGASVCGDCAKKVEGRYLCDDCYDVSTNSNPSEPKTPGGHPTGLQDGAAGFAEGRRRAEPDRVSPRGAPDSRSSEKVVGVGIGLLFVAYAVSGGFAFLPNHPEITVDATRDDLSPQGFAARLDDACAKPPIWIRAFKKSPSEITVHATNQLGQSATIVIQCRDGRADPSDQGSVLRP